MSPIYEYACNCGHSEEVIRRYEHRDEPVPCRACSGAMERRFSAHHRQPDGIYSYEPNIGTPERFEQMSRRMGGR